MSLKRSDFSSDFCFLIFSSRHVCYCFVFVCSSVLRCVYMLYVSCDFVVYLVVVMSCTSKTTC